MTAARAPGSMTPIDGHVERLLGERETCGGRGVAGDDDQLDRPLLEPRSDLRARSGRTSSRLARPVRAASRVAEVHERLARQHARDLPRHREAAEARVEDADGHAFHESQYIPRLAVQRLRSTSRSQSLLAAATSSHRAAPISSTGSTESAAPSSMAALGMPKTVDVASS